MTKDEQQVFEAVSKQNEELKSQLMATSVLGELTKVMLSTPNLEAVFKTLLLGINETLFFERIVLFQVVPDEFSLKPLHWFGIEDEKVKGLRVSLSFLEGGEFADAIFLNRPIVVDPVSLTEDPLRSWQPKSYLAIPIIIKTYNRCYEFHSCKEKECPAYSHPNPYCWCIKGAGLRHGSKDEDQRRRHCVACSFFKGNYVLFLDKPGQRELAESDDISILTTLANQTGIIIDNFQNYENLEMAHNELKSVNIKLNKTNRELKEAQAKINRDLEQAQVIQQGLLPQKFPKNDRFSCLATYIPATKVGGDYYDLFEIDKDCYCTLVADVSGHGISAALIMSMAKILIESYANSVSTKTTLDKINQVLTKDIKNDNFITMFYAIINLRENKIIYSSAGHNPILLIRRSTREITHVKADGIFLGVFDNAMVSDNVIPLQDDLRLVLYTDGLTEAENLKGEMYSYERLTELIKNTVPLPIEEVQTELMRDFRSHVGAVTLEDDVTLMIIDFK
jgi:serine phosphatase RsbU (regulator of sigma subunit)